MSEADGYRLRPVRDQRSRDERVRRGELADAVGEARDTANVLAAATEHAARARAAFESARSAQVPQTSQTPQTSAAALARTEQFIARRRKELALAVDAQLRAEAAHRGQLDAVDLARGQLVHARAQREVIERHFAHWRTERRKLAERRED